MTIARRTIGNRLAPARFILFLISFVGIAASMRTTGYDAGYALMAGFDIATIIFLASLWPVVNGADDAEIRVHARENDANRGLLLAISAVIGIVILITVAAELSQPGKPEAALIIATLSLAWINANTIYTLHYAHLYYGGDGAGDGDGLQFPGDTVPDYWDFFYFAFTLGMTFQTSDITITSRAIRQVALAHCVGAFVFNIGVLAFTINTLGSG